MPPLSCTRACVQRPPTPSFPLSLTIVALLSLYSLRHRASLWPVLWTLLDARSCDHINLMMPPPRDASANATAEVMRLPHLARSLHSGFEAGRFVAELWATNAYAAAARGSNLQGAPPPVFKNCWGQPQLVATRWRKPSGEVTQPAWARHCRATAPAIESDSCS